MRGAALLAGIPAKSGKQAERVSRSTLRETSAKLCRVKVAAWGATKCKATVGGIMIVGDLKPLEEIVSGVGHFKQVLCNV